jgi:O-antigen/teichoic acid export membrane protein
MKADLADHFEVNELPSRGMFVPMTAPLRNLVSRFPEVSHGVLSLVDQAIVSATSFATMVIVGRATTPDQLGLYYLVATIVFISVGVQEQIVAAPYTVYSKRYENDELAGYTGSAWIHHVSLSALGLTVLLATIAVLSLSGSVDTVPVLLALAGAGPFLLLREWVRRFAYAHLQIVPAVVLDAIVAGVQLGGLLLLWRLDLLTVYGAFLVMGLACLCGCLGWYMLERPTIHFDRSRWMPDWKHNWSFGRWTLRSFLAGNTTPYIMPWILGLAVGTAATGVFGACSTLINMSNVLLISTDRILMPRAAHAYARGGYAELRRILILAALLVLPVLAVFCLVVFAIGSQLAAFVYGAQYAGHGATLSVLAVVMLMNGIGVIAGNGLLALDQPRTNFVADVVTLVVTIASACAFVVPFGVLGAAVAILAGTSTGCVVRTLRLYRALSFAEGPTEADQQPRQESQELSAVQSTL